MCVCCIYISNSFGDAVSFVAFWWFDSCGLFCLDLVLS